jgi:DNA-binding response OmpR family regulator
LRILLVDDFVPMLETVRDFLESQGHQVFAAANAAQAEAIAQLERTMDLMITDIELPDLDGIALWKRVQPLLGAAKVIFLTGHSEELLSKGSELPGRVLSKPVDLGRLASIITSV